MLLFDEKVVRKTVKKAMKAALKALEDTQDAIIESELTLAEAKVLGLRQGCIIWQLKLQMMKSVCRCRVLICFVYLIFTLLKFSGR